MYLVQAYRKSIPLFFTAFFFVLSRQPKYVDCLFINTLRVYEKLDELDLQICIQKIVEQD